MHKNKLLALYKKKTFSSLTRLNWNSFGFYSVNLCHARTALKTLKDLEEMIDSLIRATFMICRVFDLEPQTFEEKLVHVF